MEQQDVVIVAMGGDDDPWAVVDGAGRVRGLRGLSVIDASIFPEIPSTPTNLTTIMVATRLAQTWRPSTRTAE